ncbi:MAG: hypothetical protein GX681_04355 [Clostridiaceae bacterium]|nr:hypothetical protein [Clostridiaceae bacterium]
MDMFKNFGEKAKKTAQKVGEKSSDLVEVGKLKVQISQIRDDIRRSKTEIGQYFYDTYINQTDLPEDKILLICEAIEEKYQEIDELIEKIERINN